MSVPEHPPQIPVVRYRGAKGRVLFALQFNGKMPAKEFEDEELSIEQSRKLKALFRMITSGEGPLRNDTRFKHERGKIFALKLHGVRVYCFQVGPDWILTNGCFKKRDRADPTELARAERIMEEHLSRFGKNKP